jgi:hypothetical protein
MGQAKQRGTFEQRKAEAIEREKKRQAEIDASMALRPASRSRSHLAAMLAIIGAGSIGGRNVG